MTAVTDVRADYERRITWGERARIELAAFNLGVEAAEADRRQVKRDLRAAVLEALTDTPQTAQAIRDKTGGRKRDIDALLCRMNMVEAMNTPRGWVRARSMKEAAE